jgi:Domain of unknown function (DUF4267)
MSRSPLLLGATGERRSATQMGIARSVIGGSALLLPGLAAPLFGLPKEQDTPGGRFLGRAFGIRNIVLGIWAIKVQDADLEARRFCYRANMAVDAADIAIVLWPLIRRQGLDRFALTSLALAVAVTVAWADLLELAAAGPV